MNTFTIEYRFTFPDQRRQVFTLVFSHQPIRLVSKTVRRPPSWTDLAFHQCSHCPLTVATHPQCPVAINLVPVIERFDQLMSFDKIKVEVINERRRVGRQTSAQEGISSLMGLLIAGSDCPHTHFFKPMARFHLPFASRDETMWRAAATYLLANYYAVGGLTAKALDMAGLAKIYDDVAKLNDAVIMRLRDASNKDSTVNALVHLDVFAKFLTPPLEDAIGQIEPIFRPFLKGWQPKTG